MKENRLMLFDINLLRKIPLLLACVFFSWSVLVPFYNYLSESMIETRYSISYWSFKAEIRGFYGLRTIQGVRQEWFLDYWFGDPWLNLGLSWLLLAMFVAQIVTLVAGIISVFNAKKTLAVVPVATCLTTMLLMVYQNIIMSSSNLLVYTYQLGYLLTYPSLGLFIMNLLLTLALSKSEMR